MFTLQILHDPRENSYNISFGDPLLLGNFSLLAFLSLNWIFLLTIHQRCMDIFQNNTLVTQQYPKKKGLQDTAKA